MPLVLLGLAAGVFVAFCAKDTADRTVDSAMKNGRGCKVEYEGPWGKYKVEVEPEVKPEIDWEKLRAMLQLEIELHPEKYAQYKTIEA